MTLPRIINAKDHYCYIYWYKCNKKNLLILISIKKMIGGQPGTISLDKLAKSIAELQEY